jgi:D-alanine-D-alanine ligase
VKVVVLHTAEALEPPADPILEQIRAALTSGGHTASLLAVGSDVEPVIAGLRASTPDLVFNLAESFGGKSALESNVAALLNLLGLHYTGSSPAGLLLAGDKSLTKKMLRLHDIRSPEFSTLYRGALDWAGDLNFPLIVKPPQEDASIGITSSSIVHDLKELFGKIAELQSEFQGQVLVEEFVDGREFYVGVLGNVNPEALPVIELDFSAMPAGRPRIASWEAKWGTDGQGAGEEFAGTKSVFPDGIAEDLVKRMQSVAIECFQALRLRDYARIDLRVTPAGEVYVIEVNPNCYLERESEFARAAERSGLSYDALISRIVDLASARYAR